MKLHLLSLSLMAIFATPVFATQEVVGKVSFTKGSNAAQQPNSSPRLLGKDAEIYQGDNIQTSDDSFVIIEFIDHSKVTVRPNSNFKIEQFDNATKNAKLTVYEGGVRASTGEFSKTAGAFQIKTPSTTLNGAKESDYSVRVCNHDCDEKKDTSVAKIVDIKGDVFAENHADKNATQRKLTIGSGVNSQDYLTSKTNSYALMVFRDGEKITLQANSQLDIVNYDFQNAGKKDQILLKLAAGGMRALTGLIGKKDHSAYAVDTPVATIGIRGTEYEAVCVGDCVNNDNNDEGLYSHVTQGAISQTNETGETVLTEGQNNFIANTTTTAAPVATLPASVVEKIDASPSPQKAQDADKVYSLAETNNMGSYVVVNKGSGELLESNDTFQISENPSMPIDNTTDNITSERNPPNNTVVLFEGESRFLGNDSHLVMKLPEPPSFIVQDNTPPPNFDNASPVPEILLNDKNINVNPIACVVE